MTSSAQTGRIARRKTEFRDRITEAALRLFAQQGMADTSIAAIIEEADIAHKTFFNHFPTRDHLLQHILASYSEQAYGLVDEVFKHSDDPVTQLDYCLVKIAKVLEPLDAPRYRELISFYFMSSTNTQAFREAQKKNFHDLILKILQHAKTQQRLKLDMSLETQTDVIVGLCIATLLNWSVEEKYPIVRKTRQMLSFIEQTIFTASASNRSSP